MKHYDCLLLALCLVSSYPLAAQNTRQQRTSPAESLEMRIDPGSLAPLVLDQKVRLMTHDGTYAEGRVVKASEASLTLQVRKTEPKGNLLFSP